MAVLGEATPVPAELQRAVEQLEELSDRLELRAADWSGVSLAGRQIANSLRSEGLRTTLGRTSLLSSSGRLLDNLAGEEGEEQDSRQERLAAQTELARVVGNMCFEHDPNRQQTLDAGILRYLARLLSILLGVSDDSATHEGAAKVLSLKELTFVRAATGAMLNSSLKFDPVRRELTRREYLVPLLAIINSRTVGKATAPVYTTGSWAVESADSQREQRLQIGSMAAGWAANVLEDVLVEDKSDFPVDLGVPALASVILASASSPSTPSSVLVPSDDAADYLDTDIELLTISASLLEGVVQNSDAAKSAIAFSTFDPSLPYPQRTLLHHLIDFIKTARPPPYWSSVSDDPARTEKAFSTIKAAVVRAVVEAPNSDEVMERLWEDTKNGKDAATGGKSWLVEELVRWLEEAEEGREDMLVCASHMLAGLGRRDEHTLSLARDYQLASPLARIVRDRVSGAVGKTGRPGETTQVLFGVVSLLRHLAIPAANRQVIGETGVVPFVSQLLRKELDVVQPLQLATVGLLKQLASGDVSNALVMLDQDTATDPSSANTATSTLDLLLSLSARVDDLRFRSETTRVVANLVRTLFAAASDNAAAEQVEVGRQKLTSREVPGVLAGMVSTSERYPVLVNEGVVGLTLLAGSGEEGAALVLDALLASPTQPATQPSSGDSDPSSAMSALTTTASAPPPPATTTPSSAAFLLATWLSSAPSSSPISPIRPEMLANVASLVFAVLHGTAGPEEKETKRSELRRVVEEPLRIAAGVLTEGAVGEALKRALDLVEQDEQA
ncbi:RHTO0S06e08768g1_1 [Rhodotorula toruloides]|uniref:RHTO0S06e08768g1_1 n=1 Tax=Rhodotorula toruloides TaxID=5286 RepID=A0A061B4U9_RHOTO|nr:RHTO0S06e08768g1_1 [Rhodotorula toruloides]